MLIDNYLKLAIATVSTIVHVVYLLIVIRTGVCFKPISWEKHKTSELVNANQNYGL